MVQVGILLEFRDLCLTVICGEESLQREIRCVDLNRPGLEVTGCFDFFDEERIQIFGGGEIQYIKKYGHLPESERTQLKAACHRILGVEDNNWDNAYIVRKEAEEALRYA